MKFFYKKNVVVSTVVSTCTIVLISVLFFYYIKNRYNSSVNIQELMTAIDNSKQYLDTHILPSGKTIYRSRIDDDTYTTTKYNILRHSGTIYSMYLYDKDIEKDHFKSLRLAMVEYLKKNYIKPYKELMAVVSKPEEEGLEYSKVKLGALGLALIGISSLYEDDQEYLKLSLKDGNKKILEGLANFISFLQKPDGSFFSAFDYDDLEKDEDFISLYYPGEACLGLLFLYSMDKNIVWFNMAKKSLLYLANLRKTKLYDIPFDHWMIIATEKLLSYGNLVTDEEKKVLIYQVVQVSFSILSQQIRFGKYSGDFFDNNKPCSVGTIVEGLVAAYKIFMKNIEIFNSIKSDFFDKKISLDNILITMGYSVNYLIRVQVKKGPWLGAIPSRGDWRKNPSSKSKMVQIDNVQHVLSGWIGYYQIYKEFLLQ